MRILTPLWRSARVLEHLVTGAGIGLFIVVGRPLGLRVPWLADLVRWWYARLCRALGLHLEVTGDLAPNALLVANHVSWLDIPVIGAQGRIGFLSKADVKDWPLIGWMAKIAGTLFIARGANKARAVIRQIAEHASGGGRIVIFPEGTTTDGTRLQRFHPRLFAAAQHSGVQVQPVALRYGTNNLPDEIAPFIGDDALVPHLFRLIRHPELRVLVEFLTPLDGSRLERGTIASYCRDSIASALGIDSISAPSLPNASAAAESAQVPATSISPNLREVRGQRVWRMDRFRRRRQDSDHRGAAEVPGDKVTPGARSKSSLK